MHDLFISYAREDADWVEQFSNMLKSEGLVVWKDSSIPTGKSFGRVIEEAIASSRAVVVWDLGKGQERLRLTFGGPVSALSFVPGYKTLLVFSTDGEARLINLAFGDAKRFPLDGTVRLIRFSSPGDTLAFASGGRVRVAAADEPARVLLEYGHADNVTEMRFSEDGRLIASAGQDGMVRVWDIAAASELTRLAFHDQVLALLFSSDGTTLTVIARSGQVGIWPVVYGDPATEACRRLQRNLTPEEWRRHLHPQPYRKTCTLSQP